MGTATIYWHVDFSFERIETTRSLFFALVTEAKADETASRKIRSLVDDMDLAVASDTISWLITAITEQLSDRSVGEGPKIKPSLRVLLLDLWDDQADTGVQSLSFEELYLSSKSPWDLYLKSLSPDLPTRLSDYALAIVSGSKFERFWAAIHSKLTPEQTREIKDWYGEMAKFLTGEQIQIGD